MKLIKKLILRKNMINLKKFGIQNFQILHIWFLKKKIKLKKWKKNQH